MRDSVFVAGYIYTHLRTYRLVQTLEKLCLQVQVPDEFSLPLSSRTGFSTWRPATLIATQIDLNDFDLSPQKRLKCHAMSGDGMKLFSVITVGPGLLHGNLRFARQFRSFARQF